MPRPAPLLVIVLAACAGQDLPPLETFTLKGDYRTVATCLRSQLLATERDMIYVADPPNQRIFIRQERENGSAVGRRFEFSVAQAAPDEVQVDLLRAGQTYLDQDQFAARLQQALGGCG
jgi:hypothetical protein